MIVAANLMAMLVQYLSAKTGIATGRNLPELCRERFPRPVTWGLWIQAEVIAIATDLAAFVGAAIALNLLFGVPPFAAGLITAVVAFAILELQTPGYRRFELAIVGFLGIVCLGFLYDLRSRASTRASFAAGPDPGLRRHRQHPAGGRDPRRDGHAARRLPALGADQRRIPTEDVEERREPLRFQRLDVLLAMGIAGAINLTMLVVAAELFHDSGHTGVDTIEGAYAGFEALVGGGAALAFAVALLASGLSSSSVGTFAGQVVMQGFIDRRITCSCAARSRWRPRSSCSARARPVLDARDLPGRALVRHPVRARADDPAHAPRGRDGRARQPPPHDRGRLHRGRADHRAQRLPALRDFLRLDARVSAQGRAARAGFLELPRQPVW